MKEQKDLFGETVQTNPLLRERFIEPPFSVLDARSGNWQNRKRRWKQLGIKSEVGRGTNLTHNIPMSSYKQENMQEEYYERSAETGTSVFDPALTELMYSWFCPPGGKILDPFAGGSVRGIVAHYLGYNYAGCELRPEQVESNRQQAEQILDPDNQPTYLTGDSDYLLDNNEEFPGSGAASSYFENADMIFSCPPYADLEVYSDLPTDLSNMKYPDFLRKYRSIIRKSLRFLKPEGFAVFVVGEVRGPDGYYYDFVGDTKKAFIDCGAKLYNDAILLNTVGSASMRANKQFSASDKLVKIHQNVLIFKR